MPTRRATGTLTCALALVGALVATTGPPAADAARATSTAAAAGWRPVVPAPTPGEITPIAAPGARCADATGTWLGMRWQGSLQWRVNTSTVPAYLGTPPAVVESLKNAAVNVDHGRNDCGLPEGIGPRQKYAGVTPRRAGVNGNGGCTERDGQNVVSFGPLRPGLLAVTCIWWYGTDNDGDDGDGDGNGGRSVEADILIDDAGGKFFLTTPAGCATRWDLESTITHEFGHAFGLGHVPYTEHGSLTMSDGLPDCTTAYRGLGLGDYLTLRSHYGRD